MALFPALNIASLYLILYPVAHGTSLVAQMVKNLPAMQETWVKSLGWEDLLEKGMATHSSVLAWEIPWTEEPGGLPSMGLQRVGYDRATKTKNLYLLTPYRDFAPRPRSQP